MPKLKTKSAVKKRFSVTGTGKLKRNFAFRLLKSFYHICRENEECLVLKEV